MLVTLPNLPDPTAADEDDGAARGRRGRRRPARDHLELAGELIDMEARRAAVGLALRLPARATSCCSSSRSCAGRSRSSRGHGFEPVIPPVLVREEALYGTGFLPDTEQQIYRLRRRRPLPRGHQRGRARLAARGRDPRRGAAAALRGLLVVLPARGGRRRARTRAGSSACTSSTRSRCSRSSSPARRTTSTSGCWRSRRRSCRSSRSPTAWSTSRVGDLGAQRGQEVRLRGVAARPGALPRADVDLEHHRLPGAAPATSATAPRRARAPRCCTRSTAPR